MNFFPMHSWHPMVIHFPLVALLLAAGFDAMAAWRKDLRWRHAAGMLWLVGLAGAAAAITTGLLAYGRVEHSDPAHEAMTFHRNLAYATTALLLATALLRWRFPFSRPVAGLAVLGATALGGVGYLGGELVYRHALGIPSDVLQQVRTERLGPEVDLPGPSGMPMDSVKSPLPSDSARPPVKPHSHKPGEEHEG